MTFHTFCKEDTQTGLVICYDDETGMVCVAAKCHPVEEITTHHGASTCWCKICNTSYTDVRLRVATSVWTTSWNVRELEDENEDGKPNEWVAVWTGLDPEDVTFEMSER